MDTPGLANREAHYVSRPDQAAARARRKRWLPAYDLILKGGTVVNQDGAGLRDIGVRGGRIAAIGDLARGSAGELIDCRGLHILPGVIDSQVHFREPGLEHKEDLESGSRAAVLGGVTAVFEMPNTNPLTTSAETLADKVRRGTQPHALRLRLLGRRHARQCRPTSASWNGCRALPASRCSWAPRPATCWSRTTTACASILKNTRRRAAFHSEDEFRLRERARPARRRRPVLASGLARRDRRAALDRAAGRASPGARGARIHVLHISTAEEIAFLERHKDVASCEATPHHLTLTADDYATARHAVADEPAGARRRATATASGSGMAQGIVDVLGSDHAPHTLEEKAKPYPASPSGMTGRADAGADHARSRQCRPADAGALRRSDQPRPAAPVRHGAQGPHRRRLRRRFHHRRPEAPRDHHAMRRPARKAGWTPYDGKRGHRLAGRHHRPRPARDVGGRDRRRPAAGRAGAVFAKRCRRGRSAFQLAQSPATKNDQRAVRRDADAVEDVGAVGLHVLVVAGGDDLEQLDPLPRRQLVERHGEEIRPHIHVRSACRHRYGHSRRSAPLRGSPGSPGLPCRRTVRAGRRSGRRRCRRATAGCRLSPVPSSGRSISMLPRLAGLDNQLAHALAPAPAAWRCRRRPPGRGVGIDLRPRHVSGAAFVGAVLVAGRHFVLIVGIGGVVGSRWCAGIWYRHGSDGRQRLLFRSARPIARPARRYRSLPACLRA